MRRILAALAILVPALAFGAAPRYVYVDTNGNGQLNDCPNPAHNIKGLAGNTDELVRCTDVTPNEFYCTGGGCQAWTRDCTVGNRANVVNGDTVVVDGTLVGRVVYAAPMACVWDMAKSDSCELHAGVYSKPGARNGTGNVLSALCARNECFNSDMVFLGKGPHLGMTTSASTGYGTRASPGFVIGARLNGSQDTWDSDGDKRPDCDNNSGTPSCWGTCLAGTNPGEVCKLNADCAGGTTCVPIPGQPNSYPPILDGNADTYPMTVCVANGAGCAGSGGNNPSCCTGAGTGPSCDAASCNTGAFYDIIFGCGSGNLDSTICSANADGHTPVYIDVNGDGLFNASTENVGPKPGDFTSGNFFNSSWITVKDIETRKHNGASACTSSTGTRDYQGSISLMGAPTSALGEGYVVEHIFNHGDLYAAQGLCDSEDNTALYGDNSNHNTAEPGVFKNSLVILGQKFFYNNDGGEYELVGGSKNIYGNHFIFPPRVKQPDGSNTPQPQSFARTKGLDANWTNGLNSTLVKNVTAVWNNELDFQWVDTCGSCTYPSRVWQNETWGRSYHAAATLGQGGPRCAELPSPGVSCATAGAACGTGGAFVCGNFWDAGLGELWFHGNLVRLHGAFATGWSRFANSFCDIDHGATICPGCVTGATNTPRMHYYEFNNTIDIERASDTSTTTTWGNLCEGSGTPQQIETYVNKNNVFYRATTATNDPTYTATNCATTGNRRCLQNNICTQSQTGCTTQTADRTAIWGSNNKNAGTFSGPESYVPVSGTPVYESTSNNPCDPDGDGVLGVDWNHDGVNDLVWTDIRGYVQDCSSGANPTQKMSLGAVQPFNDAVSAPVPTLFRGARLRGAKI